MFELLENLSLSHRLSHAWQDSHIIETKQLKHVDWQSFVFLCLLLLLGKTASSNKLTRAWISSYMIENNMLCRIDSIEINIYGNDWQNRLSNDWVTWLANTVLASSKFDCVLPLTVMDWNDRNTCWFLISTQTSACKNLYPNGWASLNTRH